MKYTPFLETVRTTLFSLIKHLETKEEQRRINSSLRGKKPHGLTELNYLSQLVQQIIQVNLIAFTLLLVHLILRISPHHSHYLRSHHLSLPPPFTPDLKLISFTNPFLHSHSYSFRTAFTDLNLYCIKEALALFVLVSFLSTCAR